MAEPFARRRKASGCAASACCCPQPRTMRNFKPASQRSMQALALLGWTIGRNVRIDTRWATRQCRRHSPTRGGIGRARARRHSGPWRRGRGGDAAGDPHRADRVPSRQRSGRRRLRRQPGAAGRQRHRFHVVRIQPGRETAGTAQADRAGRDASGSPSGSTQGGGTSEFAVIQAVAPSLRVEVNPVNTRDAGEIDRAVAAFARSPNGGLIVTSGARRHFIAI